MISHYKIIEKIGEGGMGVVYKATDTRLDRVVALKFLPPRLICDSEARDRFEHEAKAASALSHPNIATIYEIDQVEGRCFISMEYLEGGSLKAHMGKRDLSIKEILDLAIQIGEGLSAAHERGVVHRDIKPDNIMLTAKGLPKIMDFGLAKLKGATKVTKTGTTLGTLQYMSPEQAGGREVDQRSDIFSFGVILYEMVAGRLPFCGEYEAAIINSILNETPEPVARYKADIPDGVQRIVDRALEKDVGERYQHADDLVAELKHEKRLLETGESKVSQVGMRPMSGARSSSVRRFLPVVIPAVIAAAVILLILIFEPFRIEVGPGDEASAQENSLAIMYFENMVDPEDTDRTAQMITSLLITDLSESQYLRVVSRQRLYDILRLLGKEDLKAVDRTVASEVADEAEVKWILTGSILKTQPEFILTAEISEASTGDVLATQTVRAAAEEDLFAVVDKLTEQIKSDLSLPAGAEREEDRPVASVTTHSPEAYRHYLEALDHSYEYNLTESEEGFRAALSFDSTFAMAYYQLANIDWMKGGSRQRELIAQAVRYSDRVSEAERYYINAYSATLSHDFAEAIENLETLLERFPDEKQALSTLADIWGTYLARNDKTIEYLTRAIELDPLDGLAYNNLAYAYSWEGDFEKAIQAANKYVSTAPDEPNPYDTRGDIYATFGDLDKAIESYRTALEVRQNFPYSLCKLGTMHLFRRDYSETERYYLKLCSSRDGDIRSKGRYHLALIPVYQGKLAQALEVINQGLGADRMEQTNGSWAALKHFLAASVLQAQGKAGSALDEFNEGLDIWLTTDPEAKWYWAGYNAVLLTENGEFDAAQEVALNIKRSIKTLEEARMLYYWLVLGNIELTKGNPDTAATYLERAAETADPQMLQVWIARARAYLEAGRLAEAVEGFAGILGTYHENRLDLPIQAVKCHYMLGIAYEQSGWTNKAVEQYEEFLEIWKDADPGISEVEDARERLARLKDAAS
jgi:serine/threonine protein kinase/tetratricopeptide (TPR) repeat protein